MNLLILSQSIATKHKIPYSRYQDLPPSLKAMFYYADQSASIEMYHKVYEPLKSKETK